MSSVLAGVVPPVGLAGAALGASVPSAQDQLPALLGDLLQDGTGAFPAGTAAFVVSVATPPRRGRARLGPPRKNPGEGGGAGGRAWFRGTRAALRRSGLSQALRPPRVLLVRRTGCGGDHTCDACPTGPGRPLSVRGSVPSAGDTPPPLHTTLPSRSRARRDGCRRRVRLVGAVAGLQLIVRHLLRGLCPHERAEDRGRRRPATALRRVPRQRRVRSQAGALAQLDAVSCP